LPPGPVAPSAGRSTSGTQESIPAGVLAERPAGAAAGQREASVVGPPTVPAGEELASAAELKAPDFVAGPEAAAGQELASVAARVA
jgi:hypothetical protein